MEDDSISLELKVKNTGVRSGSEIVQLYINDEKSSIPRPEKELKGFQKVVLAPGEEKTVKFTIGKAALSYFDAAKHERVAEKGRYNVRIGAASDDIRTQTSFSIK